MGFVGINDLAQCLVPGSKIRSQGQGRGLAVGRGRGPIGVPVGRKTLGVIQKEWPVLGPPTYYEAGPGAEFIKEAFQGLDLDPMECLTPGNKIRSQGQGRGLAVGRGRGPIGIPVGRKILVQLGQEKERPSPEEIDIVSAVKAMYGGYLDAEPFIEFAGNHPVLLTTLLIGAVILGGSIGGYIGAGLRTVK